VAYGCGGSTPPVRTRRLGKERAVRNTTTFWAPLAEIRMSHRSTRALSSATVERYRQWLEEGRGGPPVRLARHGDGYLVRDGRHRVAAALAAGWRFIEAEVRPISRLLRRVGLIARLYGRRCSSRPHGDEVLLEERLVCTEEERVRVPPSPSGLRSVNGKHTPFVRLGCGFESCRRLSHARSSKDRAPPCEGGGRWFESSRAYSRGRSS
jgi:hypothetical protein